MLPHLLAALSLCVGIVLAGSIPTCFDQSKCLKITVDDCNSNNVRQICLVFDPDGDCAKKSSETVSHVCQHFGEPGDSSNEKEDNWNGQMCRSVSGGETVSWTLKDGKPPSSPTGPTDYDLPAEGALSPIIGTCEGYKRYCTGKSPGETRWTVTAPVCSPQCTCTGNWVNVGVCSSSCGGGKQKQMRSCTPNTPGADCSAEEVREINCNDQPCQCSCDGDYKDITECSVSCGTGTKRQQQTCSSSDASLSCDHLELRDVSCNAGTCQCQCLDDWSELTGCSKECGGGLKTQRRTCTAPAGSDLDCEDESERTIPCNEQECLCTCSNTWYDQTPCDKNCGTGKKMQTRSCSPPSGVDLDCSEEKTRTVPCNTQACECSCQDDWTDSTSCSKECGGGTKTQRRTCTAPAGSGLSCESESKRTVECNTQNCGCTCGEWMTMTGCSAQCYGFERQYRVCTGGPDCGLERRTELCNDYPGCGLPPGPYPGPYPGPIPGPIPGPYPGPIPGPYPGLPPTGPGLPPYGPGLPSHGPKPYDPCHKGHLFGGLGKHPCHSVKHPGLGGEHHGGLDQEHLSRRQRWQRNRNRRQRNRGARRGQRRQGARRA